ncbi:MAG: ABC transporter ATP-binding protein [Desulfobacterales bacterium]
MTATDTTSIKVDNISKRYRIGLKEQVHDRLGSALFNLVKSPWKNYRQYRSLYKFDEAGKSRHDLIYNPDSDIIWALKEVSFTVEPGEVLGIIGSNGAGKSTLLKILSRITCPTLGSAEIKGRISTLLEVGTGFHPELTGRENVYLNGSILGMRKGEIDHKFDEIVDFSGIEKFIDTPVKRYSSGMKVRLAFSVAAHLQSEVIIVDEVLAVGDADFQKKCIAKMETAGELGRTVLLVSHSMASITRLCHRAILIEDGILKNEGPADKVVMEYLSAGSGTIASKEWSNPAEAPGNDVARLLAVRVMDGDGRTGESFDIRKPIVLEMVYEVMKEGFVMLPHFRLTNDSGIPVFETLDNDPAFMRKKRPAGHYTSRVVIPGNFMAEGMVYVSCHLLTMYPNVLQFSERHVIAFQVIDSLEGDSARGDWQGSLSGVVRPLLDWQTRHAVN